MDNEAYKSGKKSFAHIQVSGFFLSFSFRAYQELLCKSTKCTHDRLALFFLEKRVLHVDFSWKVILQACEKSSIFEW